MFPVPALMGLGNVSVQPVRHWDQQGRPGSAPPLGRNLKEPLFANGLFDERLVRRQNHSFVVPAAGKQRCRITARMIKHRFPSFQHWRVGSFALQRSVLFL